MDLADFLSRSGITRQDVIAKVDSAVHLTPGDVLFVSGSLVEELGNEKSDLDLFLITSRTDIQFTSLHDVIVVVNDCIIDIRVVQHSAVEEILGRFNHWARQPRLARNAFEFTDDDRKFLHRLLIGEAFYGASDLRKLKDCLDAKDLARHKLDWARHLAGTIQIDLAGLHSAGDQYSMLFAAQELLGHTMDGLLAGYGYTNPNQKWRVRLLARLPVDWEQRLPGTISGMSAVENFMMLHKAPESTSRRAIFEHTLRIAAFSRRVFPWAELNLLGSPEINLPLAAVAIYDRTEEAQPLPCLNFDVKIRFTEGHFELLRLGEKGPIFQLSPQAYALLCLFDGEHSMSAAIDYAKQLGSKERAQEEIEDMIAMIRYAQFEAGTVIDEQALEAILRG